MNTITYRLFTILPLRMQHSIMVNLVKKNYAVNDYNKRNRTNVVLDNVQEKILDTFVRNLNGTKTVLDLGCGNGALYDIALDKRDCRITGLDISPRQLECARKLLPNHKFIQTDFMKYIPDKQFDGITAFYSIYNIPRKLHKRLLRRCYRWLTNKGCMLVNVRKEDIGEAKYWGNWCGAPLVFSYYSAEKFIEIARSVGFTVSQFQQTHNDEYVWLLLSKDPKASDWI